MKIGLFFGTFDPIHIGHQSKIVEVLNKKLVDRVVIVPTTKNPWKQNNPMFDYHTRLKMCGYVAHNLCVSMFGVDNAKIMVSDIEGNMKPMHYTYEVLEELKDFFKFDKLCILCGTDVANSIKNWKNGDEIIKNYEIINLDRGGYVDDVEDSSMLFEVSSSQIRKMILDEEEIVPYVSYEVNEMIKKYIKNKFNV